MLIIDILSPLFCFSDQTYQKFELNKPFFIKYVEQNLKDIVNISCHS